MSTTTETTEPQTLLDAAENVVIAFGMGWDMEGVIENLRAAIEREQAWAAIGGACRRPDDVGDPANTEGRGP